MGFWDVIDELQYEKMLKKDREQSKAFEEANDKKEREIRREEEIYRKNYIISSEGALPFGSELFDGRGDHRIRESEGSGSPIGNENNHSVRKRLANSALYCTNCGHLLKTKANFCGSCGTKA